ncbi:endothelin-converting enzyme [Sporothrix brasiliensis 5110]|uniref:Endothelin-converting enzyme n=1 Tax=Sporothrix brasiliensis 5110 TaxID=1398154 RepID=A0A0C2F040_9PEZI|nr:endothelin-converting enzyme [Sporothrix brasiliensis 5110]KIH92144.1 endothelin-converting enzyme [Sporothrix brasiliensis 5110]
MASPATNNGPSESSPLLDNPPDGHTANGDVEEGRFRRGYRSVTSTWTALGIQRIAIVILIIALVLVATILSRRHDKGAATGLCLTPACIHAADGYLTNLSPNYKNMDPCDDFEEFVCGGWRGAHDMRADQGMTDALGLINDGVTSTIRNILEGSYPDTSSHSTFSPSNLNAAVSSTDRKNFEELKAAYDACMDVDAITKQGIQPIVALIDELAKTFGSSSTSPVDYSDSVLFLKKRGINSFFSFYVSDDDKDPETQIIGVSPVRSFGLPSKQYFEDKDVVDQYLGAMTKVLGAIKPSVAKIGPADKAAKALVAFESRLSQAAPDKEDMDDVTKTYNLLSVKDTSKLLPNFGFEKALKELVPTDYTLNMTVTAFPEVLANVSQIVAETPAEVVQNFLYWRLIVYYSSAVLGPEIRPWRQFQNVLQGKDADADPERWRTCVSHAGGTLGWILSRFFVEASFSAAAKGFGNRIISDIKAAYLQNFDSLAWMDDETRKVAAEKVHNIDQKVGYPAASPNIMDPEDLKTYYEAVQIGDSFFGNILSSDDFDNQRMWATLGKPTDMNEWGMLASTVNAYYNPPHNEIVFPAGIMQFPLFSVDLPSYVSYGAFGAVAGHELSHAFDNNGRHYDLHGRYNNWWTNATIDAFTDKAQCIVDEFNNFTVIGKDGPIHIKGRQTLGENIADSGGLTAARLAWDMRRAAAKRDGTATSGVDGLSLPGLDAFTHEQLFYISYGNAWCSKFRPAMLTNRVTTDEHSPDPIRIKGTLLNSRGFREAFQCPVKEPTCELW